MTPRKRRRRQRLCTEGGEGRSTVEVIVCALSGTKQLPRGRIGSNRLIASGKQPMGAFAQAQLGSGRLARNHKNPVTAVSKPDLRAEAREGRVKVATEEAQPLQPRRGLVIQGRGELHDLRCDCIGSVEFSGTYGCRA